VKDVSIKFCAKRVPIFSTLNSEEINKVVNLIIRKRYSRGEMIVLEGSHLDRLIIINSGKVKAFRIHLKEKSRFYISFPSDFSEKRTF